MVRYLHRVVQKGKGHKSWQLSEWNSKPTFSTSWVDHTTVVNNCFCLISPNTMTVHQFIVTLISSTFFSITFSDKGKLAKPPLSQVHYQIF